MIDIGVNLLHSQFDPDRAAVVARARTVGVDQMIITSTNLATTRQAIDYCAAEESRVRHSLFCTAGIHPHDAKDAGPDYAAELESLVRSPRVKAVGEMGLDFNRNFSPADIQRSVFARQLRLAVEAGKPVFVHDRDSNGEVYAMLDAVADELSGVVVHCFTGTATDLDRYLQRDFYIGITGWICDLRRGAVLRELVARIPLTRLLIESDAPFLLPQTVPADWQAELGVSGIGRRRNEPALLGYVAAEIAELKELPMETVATATAANAARLFSLGQPADD